MSNNASFPLRVFRLVMGVNLNKKRPIPGTELPLPARIAAGDLQYPPPPFAGQCASLEEQMQRLAEQYEQERKAHIELTSLLGEHIKHVGELTTNYKG